MKVPDQILQAYGIKPSKAQTSLIDLGHINSSYKVEGEDGFLLFLQKVNTEIFSDINALSENLHRASVVVQQKSSNPQLRLYRNSKGESITYFDQETWRAFYFLEGYVSMDQVINEENIVLAGRTIANFAKCMFDVKTDDFVPIIPHFHSLDMRLSQLKHATNFPVNYRLDVAKRTISRIEVLTQEVNFMQSYLRSANYVERIVHNDTKMSNIMLNPKTGDACMIDYDSVMPGSVLFDFGDAVRSFISPLEEGERPTADLDLRWNLFVPFLNAYLEEAESFITDQEKVLLGQACIYMPLIMGVRFMTDYLLGDVYFHTKSELDNLHRAENQILLAETISKVMKK